MKKKIVLSLLVLVFLFTITGCGTKEEQSNVDNIKSQEKNDNNQQNIINNNSNNSNNSNNNNNNIIDDEIIEFDDEDNGPLESKNVESTLINCNDCVFAFFKDKKKFGDKVSEYTKDYATLKDDKGYQRRRFLGLVLDASNNIQRAYACGIEKGKAYCLEGTPNGSSFEYNIGILNKVFTTGCSYNTNNTRYTCIGETNGDTRTDGYVSVHYDENCHIFGKTIDHEALIYCY